MKTLYRNLSEGFASRRERLKWYVKQLFPLTYRSRYGTGDGVHFVVWRMWFGRCFDIDDVLLPTTSGADRA
jgi:hypothetical protein